MRRVRENAGGVTRWAWDLDHDEVAAAVLAILHALAASLPDPTPPPVEVAMVPEVGRCPRCGAWRWDGVCTVPHHLARTRQYRAEQDGRRGRRIPRQAPS